MDRALTPLTTPNLPWNTAWIVGGSSGIGKELAYALSAQGVRTAVSARSLAPLQQMASEHPDTLHAFQTDVTDLSALRRTYEGICDKLGHPSLVVLNAATWDPMSAADYSAGRATASMLVNYAGVCNALETILYSMRQRKTGHIAIVASVAGYRGLTQSLAYGPTKAALINLAESLNLELKKDNIKVSLINPGFVDTPMTARNDFPMPYIVSSKYAADAIVRGLKGNAFEIAFPWRFVMWLKLLRLLPYSLYFPLARAALKL